MKRFHKGIKFKVNYCQTPEERRRKYGILRSFNYSRNAATKMRDWRLSSLEAKLWEDGIDIDLKIKIKGGSNDKKK